MTLKIYASVAKGLKLKVKQVLGIISKFFEITGEKLAVETF